MRLLFSDLHISQSNLSFKKKILEQVVEIGVKKDIKHLDFGGDWFQSRKGQPLEVLTFTETFLNSLPFESITMIAGNHDKLDYESMDSFLDVFGYFPKVNLVKTDYVKDNIAYLPYFLEGDLYNAFLSEFEKRKNYPNILITHVGVDGYSSIGGKINSAVTASQFSKFKQVFIGHYHNRGKLGKNICYFGSTNPSTFGEDNEKGVCLYDEISGEYELVNLNFPKFYTFNYSLSEGTEKIIKFGEREREKNPDDNIRFILSGKKEEVISFPNNRLSKLGIKPEFEVELEYEDIEQKPLQKISQTEFLENFSTFCKDKGFADIEIGQHYLSQVL